MSVDQVQMPQAEVWGADIGSVLSDANSPSFERLSMRLTADADLAPGRLVVVHAGRATAAFVLCRVLGVHEVNPHENAESALARDILPFPSEYAHEGESTVIYRTADLEPLEELRETASGDLRAQELVTLPRAGSRVTGASTRLIAAGLGLAEGVASGFHLGSLRGNPDVPIVLSPGIAQRHVLIVGGTGSGKSYTRGVLAEELQRWDAAQVNIDVNRELIDATARMGGVTLVPGEDFRLPLSALTAADVLDMAAEAGVQRGTNIEVLIGFAFEVLQREVRRGRRERFSVEDLAMQIEAEAPSLDMKTATSRPAANRVRALARQPYLGEPTNWTELVRPGGIVNIDCSTQSLPALRAITAAVARQLQRLARTNAIPFTVFSVDEAHLVAPNDERTVSTQVLREIARIGRHHKLGLILTTQSPADVDRNLLKRLLTRLVHSLEPDQLDSIRGVLADAPPEVVRRLTKLPVGSALLSGVTETVRHASVVDVRRRRTPDGGQTPQVWGEDTRPPALLDGPAEPEVIDDIDEDDLL